MMHWTVSNGHIRLTGGLSAPVKHSLGFPPPKRGFIKQYPRHVTAGIFGGLFGGSKGSTKTCKKCQGKGAIPCPGCKVSCQSGQIASIMPSDSNNPAFAT
ncbi:TPA: hypothetical protein ACH3X2_004556 [Trebouxia sp. C0005]